MINSQARKTLAQHNEHNREQARLNSQINMLRDAVAGFTSEDILIPALIKVLTDARLSDEAYMRLEQLGRVPSERLRGLV